LCLCTGRAGLYRFARAGDYIKAASRFPFRSAGQLFYVQTIGTVSEKLMAVGY
jgi:hypothetical protein